MIKISNKKLMKMKSELRMKMITKLWIIEIIFKTNKILIICKNN